MLKYTLEIDVREDRPWEVQKAVNVALLETVEALQYPCRWRYSKFELGDIGPMHSGLLSGDGNWPQESATEKFRGLVESGVQIIDGVIDCFLSTAPANSAIELGEDRRLFSYTTLDNTILTIRTCDAGVLSEIVKHLKNRNGDTSEFHR